MQIERSAIDFAEYNPRTITDQAKRKLKGAIEKVGLIEPLVWNRRTGRLVAGHQRLRTLDSMNKGSKAYSLHVAEVDMSDEEERSANILLNNPEAQGEWDFDKLADLLKDPALDLVASGMGSADVFKIIGEDSPDAVLQDVAERIQQARDIAESTQKAKEGHSTDYYLVVVFRDHASRRAFTDGAGLDDNRYVNGEDLAQMLDIDLTVEPEQVVEQSQSL